MENIHCLDTKEFWTLCRKFSTAKEGRQRDAAADAVLACIDRARPAASADLLVALRQVADDFHPDRDADSPLALSEMRAALMALVEQHTRPAANAEALYTCKGKGGEYAHVGVASGAGPLKGKVYHVYKDAATGAMFARLPEDFWTRMEPMTGDTPAAADAVVLEQRAVGRAEAVQIILGLSAEDGLDDCIGNHQIGCDGEWDAHWKGSKLRKLFRVDDAAWSLVQEAENRLDEMRWAQAEKAMDTALSDDRAPATSAAALSDAGCLLPVGTVAWALIAPSGNIRTWSYSRANVDRMYAHAQEGTIVPIIGARPVDTPTASAARLPDPEPWPGRNTGSIASGAARDVLAERRRQVEQEGWTPEHDDAHGDGQMAAAAGHYALACAYPHERHTGGGHVPTYWPWAPSWWKPSSKRRNLVKAGALILAEIERIDRATAKGAAGL